MSSSTAGTPAPPGHAAELTARDLMTRDVLTVPPTMPVEALAKLMADRHVSGLPVVEGEQGALLGIVTEADLIRRVAARGEPPAGWFARVMADPDRWADRYAKSHGVTARDVMTPAPLAAVEEDTPVAEIARLIEQRGVRRVPVLRDGRLVGVVSRADLLRAVLRAPAATAGQGSDERIEADIMARIRREPWNVARWLSVTVKDGTVELHGFCDSDAVRRALRVLIEGVEGVRRVEDRTEALPFYPYVIG